MVTIKSIPKYNYFLLYIQTYFYPYVKSCYISGWMQHNFFKFVDGVTQKICIANHICNENLKTTIELKNRLMIFIRVNKNKNFTPNNSKNFTLNDMVKSKDSFYTSTTYVIFTTYFLIEQ